MPETIHRKNGVTRALLSSGLLFSLVLSMAYLIQPGFISSTNNRAIDVVMNLAQAKPASGSIVVVDIDEKSLARYGQWPWPRSTLAQLLRIINASGAASIGLDLILAESDRTSPLNRQTHLDREPVHRVAVSDVSTDPLDYDQILAETLAKGPYVLGYEFVFGKSPNTLTTCGLHSPTIIWINMPDAVQERSFFFSAKDVICNRRLFSDAVAHSGFLNAAPDADGLLRRVPMLIRFEDRLYPSLTLATLMQYEKSRHIAIQRRKLSGSLELMVGSRTIPIDTQGNMIVQFSRRDDAIPRVSASDLLSLNPSPKRLKGKIVLVGSSAAGLEPAYQTSARPVHTHTDIHAQVLDNLLTGQQVVRTRKFLLIEALVGMLVAACAGLAIARMSILSSAVVCAALLAGTWIGMRLVFQARGYLFSPMFPTVMVVLNYAMLTIVKTWKIQLVVREVADSTMILLKSSEERLDSIIKAVPDIILRLDPDGRIAFLSPAIAKYAANPDTLLGESMLPLIKAEYRDAFTRLTSDVFQGVSGNLEFEAACFKGGPVWLDAHVFPFCNDAGEIVSLLGIVRDITDRKLVEKALADKQLQLEELNINLEQRVSDAVSELREKDKVLIQQSRQAAMGEMIGNIAHQWRQPLNTLGLIVQELRMTYGREEFNKESLEAHVEKAMEVIFYLSKTIEDFSNYFKSDKERRLFNVNQAVAKTLSLIKPSLEDLSIKIDVIEVVDTYAMGYEREYSQVLLNILLNCRDAFEGCSVDGQRVVKITIFKENDRSVVTIADNAGGIHEDVIDKIFDPYFTTKGPDKGTGIGLYMAKTIIEKNMGGRLIMRNMAGGAEFRIEV